MGLHMLWNPDVRAPNRRAELHETVTETRVNRGPGWEERHRERHIQNDVSHISAWAALGMPRKDAVEEYFGKQRA